MTRSRLGSRSPCPTALLRPPSLMAAAAHRDPDQVKRLLVPRALPAVPNPKGPSAGRPLTTLLPRPHCPGQGGAGRRGPGGERWRAPRGSGLRAEGTGSCTGLDVRLTWSIGLTEALVSTGSRKCKGKLCLRSFPSFSERWSQGDLGAKEGQRLKSGSPTFPKLLTG